MNIMNTLENIRIKTITLVVFAITLLVAYQSSFAAVPTRQIISNMAIGEYTEEGSTVVQVSRSNLVQTTILPVYSVNLTANSTKNVVAGQTVYFNHTLNNTGNEVDQYTFAVTNNMGDSYDFTNLSVFLDKDNDGVPDGAAITSYSLSAGESVGLIVAANVPSGATVSQSGLLTLNVTSLNNASGTKTNVDTAAVSNQSVVIVRKKFSQTTVANGDVVTVRLDYQNLGSIATGFKAPSLYQLYSPYGNLDLTPEENATAEVGFEATFWNKKMTLNAVGFYREESNSIGFFFDPETFASYYVNVEGENRVRGVETTINYTISSKLRVTGNYSFTDIPEELNRLIPKHKGNIALDFQMNSRTFASINYQYVDGRRDAFFDGGTFAVTNVFLGSYQLLNGLVKYDVLKNRMTVFGAVNNILNEEFEETIGYNTRGRNVKLGFTFLF